MTEEEILATANLILNTIVAADPKVKAKLAYLLRTTEIGTKAYIGIMYGIGDAVEQGGGSIV